MAKEIKTYEMSGFNECVTSTLYCGIKVNLTFKGGNMVMGKSATLQTDNKFAQDAIEHDSRFSGGSIRLVNCVKVDDNAKEDEAYTPTAETLVVEDVKDLNELDAWFAGKGVTLESSSKKYIAGMCEKYNVSFPNLKLK